MMDGAIGFDVVTEVKELWKVYETPAGQGTGGPDVMTPRVSVDGWKATPVTGMSGEIRHFAIGDSITGEREDNPFGTIPVSLLYLDFFPSREAAVEAYIRKRVADRIEALRLSMDLVFAELKAEILELTEIVTHD